MKAVCGHKPEIPFFSIHSPWCSHRMLQSFESLSEKLPGDGRGVTVIRMASSRASARGRPEAGAWEQQCLCLRGNSVIPCWCQSVTQASSHYTGWCWHQTSKAMLDFWVCCLYLYLILLRWFWEFIFQTKWWCICGNDTRCFEHFSCPSFLLMKMIVRSW